jgi:RimJ/RimL family protein N-acetyltransferase
MTPPVVTLREITDDDARALVRWRNENAAAFPPGAQLTVERHLDWYYDAYLLDPARVLCIVLKDGDPAGTIGLTVRHGRGELGNMILGDKSLARQGVMQAAVKQLMLAFGLDWYWLKVLPSNTACIRFYEKLGFAARPSPRDEGGVTYKLMDRGAYYEALAEAMGEGGA